MQAVFSALFYFAPIALYQGMLIVGYATLYTNAPVFSLVLDQDVSEEIAMMYPELYKDLTKVTYSDYLLLHVLILGIGSIIIISYFFHLAIN